MFDVIVIGSGFGGLHCAALLAAAGRKVLVVEKMPHHGGTGYVFRREGYGFPMGPLSFSSPRWVQDRLEALGVGEGITYRRNHFQLRSPHLDIVYSVPLDELREKLKEFFPAEQGIDSFFQKLGRVIDMVRKSGFFAGSEAARLARIPAADVIGSHVSDRRLQNLLGTMGTTPPTMSLLNLAIMWNAMSVEGIWFPSCGIHGVLDRLAAAFTAAGGELRLDTGAEEILVDDGRARGVRLSSGEEATARWVVSNADYKTTFLELIDPGQVPSIFHASLTEAACTTSEICVYLGVDPQPVDTRALRATHLFFQEREDGPDKDDDENFGGREIEICRWSDNAPDLTPPGRESYVLRVDFPYGPVAPFRTGEKSRGPGYGEYKDRLGRHLVATAAGALPGLAEAVEVMETATPLTYADWGCRHRGSIAGWSWRADGGGLGGGLLVRTPLERLLMTGIYASSGLFLGGVPTAMQTGAEAADIILRQKRAKTLV